MRGVRRGRRPARAGIGELDGAGGHVQPDEDRDEADHDALRHDGRAPARAPAASRCARARRRRAKRPGRRRRPRRGRGRAGRNCSDPSRRTSWRLVSVSGWGTASIACEPQQPGAEAQPQRPLELAAALGLVGEALELARIEARLVTGTRTPLDDNAAAPRPEPDRDDRGASHDERAEDHPERRLAAGSALGKPGERPVDHAAEPVEQAAERARRRRLAEPPLREDGGGLGARFGRRGTRLARRRPASAARRRSSSSPLRPRERRAEIDGLAVDAVDLPQLRERRGVARGAAGELAHLGGGRARGGRGGRCDRAQPRPGRPRAESLFIPAVRLPAGCAASSPGGGGQYGGWSSGSSSSRRGACPRSGRPGTRLRRARRRSAPPAAAGRTPPCERAGRSRER